MKKFFSTKNVFSVRNLTIMALLAALDVVLSRYTTIYITPQLRVVGFTYIPGALVAGLFGPWAGIVFGIVSDTVGYFSNPVGPYLPVWAISAIVTNVIQALFLYQNKFVWWRILISRILVMLIVTMGLNFIWQSLYFGAAAGVYYSSARIISNIIQLPIQVILIQIFGRIASRALNRLNIEHQPL